MSQPENFAVIGTGIIGAAVGRHLAMTRQGARVTIYEKEPSPSRHQTGHNSGVVHAGLYYKPGSLKAMLCQRGRSLLEEYCTENSIAYEEVGKVLVAQDEEAVGRLADIKLRAAENGVKDVRELDRAGLAELEPLAVGLGGIHSPHTAITDYRAITTAFLEDVASLGGSLRFADPVLRIEPDGSSTRVISAKGSAKFDRVISCGGLQSDRLVRASGHRPEVSIIPFRGNYYHLKHTDGIDLKGLIYPIPDPKYPFLGVHVTRHVDGAVSVGPNALLALGREKYRGLGVSPRDVLSIAAWPGAYPMALEHWTTGLRELLLTASKRLFMNEVQKIFSGIESIDEMEPAEAGIRAQAVDRKGALLDDFSVQRIGPLTFVMNAPSPAATASLAIAEVIAERYVDWDQG